MSNTIRNSLYAVIGLTLISLNNVALALNFWKNDELSGSTQTVDVVITKWVAFIIGFLYLVAVIIMIYGWFTILTAGWDEEKVKKGKTILMQAGAWLIVIFIAGSVVNLIIWALFWAGQ